MGFCRSAQCADKSVEVPIVHDTRYPTRIPIRPSSRESTPRPDSQTNMCTCMHNYILTHRHSSLPLLYQTDCDLPAEFRNERHWVWGNCSDICEKGNAIHSYPHLRNTHIPYAEVPSVPAEKRMSRGLSNNMYTHTKLSFLTQSTDCDLPVEFRNERHWVWGNCSDIIENNVPCTMQCNMGYSPTDKTAGDEYFTVLCADGVRTDPPLECGQGMDVSLSLPFSLVESMEIISKT